MPFDVHAAIENYGTKRDAVTSKRRMTMLDLSFDDEAMIIYVEPQKAILCDVCGLEASIFQEEGNFCLDCWQERTEPYITVNRTIEA
jgi:hypothetical protein